MIMYFLLKTLTSGVRASARLSEEVIPLFLQMVYFEGHTGVRDFRRLDYFGNDGAI